MVVLLIEGRWVREYGALGDPGTNDFVRGSCDGRGIGAATTGGRVELNWRAPCASGGGGSGEWPVGNGRLDQQSAC